MKKIDIKIIIISVLAIYSIISSILAFKNPTEVEKIVEVEKTVTVHDTIQVEVPYETITEVPYEIINEVEKLVTIHDTIKIENRVEVPVNVIKEVQKIVEVERPKTNNWYVGFGYDFGNNPFFSGTSTRLVYKTKSDNMFGFEVGIRNNITNFDTMDGRLTPYIGGTMYIKIK
jgi:hypothetical protein